MKLHLPLNLLAALMTSFSGVTLGTATLAAVSGLLMTASQSYAADVAFDGTQVNVAAGGTASYDIGTVTASTTLNFAGAGTATITNLNGTAPEAILTVNRVASGGASLSTLTLNGAGTFNGIISLYSNTTGGSQNNILNLNHAQAAQYSTIKLGGPRLHDGSFRPESRREHFHQQAGAQQYRGSDHRGGDYADHHGEFFLLRRQFRRDRDSGLYGGRDLHPGQFQQGYGAYARVLS